MTGVLIANRGEIAVRIHRAAVSLGMRTVAVFTPDERGAAHVRLADEAYPLDGESPYLDAEQLVGVARRSGCSLVHPGYGFHSESSEFAALCAKADLGFVGPSPEVLALFGDKVRSQRFAAEHDVPTLPATSEATTLGEARQFLDSLGPGASIMVKAVAGGGGRGMRVVHQPDELAWAFERCASEAERAFGSPDLYVERLLPRARHVEVQIVGDGSGAVSHLWDRDCSVQRRNQKLIEFAPCATLPAAARQPLLTAATRLAAACDYRGVATFEFLVDADNPDTFAFLEANPRIQVEHTVTEAVTGVDLVATQLDIAGGASLAGLGLSQSDIGEPRGIATQTRVNLEDSDTAGNVWASTGTLERFEVPGGPGVRVDTAGYAGMVNSGRFDSLLAKVITHTRAADVAAASSAADAALAEFRVDGIGTNIDLLRAILRRPEMRSGTVTTGFVDAHIAELAPQPAEQAPAGPPDESGVSGIVAPVAGSVVSVPVATGQRVARGEALIVLEAMKMEHLVPAPSSGIVDEVVVESGQTVEPGTVVARFSPDEQQDDSVPEESGTDPDVVRDDLAEVLARHRVGSDEARPEAVARRRRTGRRTARENVEDLCEPGTFAEHGALAIAAQRQRRSLDDLIENTPADGMITGIGEVGAADVARCDRRCVVLAYDYTVLAGTQGLINHSKTDRMLELAQRQQLPVVLFAEGGGGRPGDTDTSAASGLDVPTFATMARLSGQVPTIGIAAGRCFAGNAALLGCCDVVIATRDATIGMGGPAMIEGGGLGRYLPEEVGPVSVQVPNGVVDVLVDDEAAAVATARRYLSYFQGEVADWECADQRRLRHVVPENRVRVYDVREAVHLLADTDSVLELRPEFGVGVVTALVRIEGRPMGLIANNPAHLGGALDADAADKTARFLQLCESHGLPVVSLCDAPGFMVGPEAERTATVRHFSRMFVAGANLSVPVVGVVLRKGYGLGAQAMVGGGFKMPVATVAWPTGEIGGMGLEGAVRLGYRKELEAIEDPQQRQQAFDELLAEQYDKGKATNAAAVFELDDVIDPAETRTRIVQALPPYEPDNRQRRSFVDTW